jgi:hypothetical protein
MKITALRIHPIARTFAVIYAVFGLFFWLTVLYFERGLHQLADWRYRPIPSPEYQLQSASLA